MREADGVAYDDGRLVIAYAGREVVLEEPIDVNEEGQARILSLACASGGSEDDLPDDALVAGYCMMCMGDALRMMAYENGRLSRKVDDLIDENGELRAKLAVPDIEGCELPSYEELARSFAEVLKANSNLQAALAKYEYHSHESGKKKPTYNEWKGEAVRLRQRLEACEKELAELKAQ